MEFVINDLSLHGQFAAQVEAQAALRQFLSWRNLIAKQGLVLRISRGLLERPLTATETVRNIVKTWKDQSLRQSMIIWMTKEGPFWDIERMHGPDDYFESLGQVVTDHGLAEAAMAVTKEQSREMVSASPSIWEQSPLLVYWHRSGIEPEIIKLWNTWRQDDLSVRLTQHQVPLAAWTDLVGWTTRTCEHLTLATDVIKPLSRHPFHPGAAERLQVLLKVLDQVKASVGADGKLNEAGLRIREDHFVGEKAWFTDSSANEKIIFKNELTFKHPTNPGASLFCPWHGKVKIDQLRIHFSYPIQYVEPLYVVYIGPKITKY